jgi:hypothetical protein
MSRTIWSDRADRKPCGVTEPFYVMDKATGLNNFFSSTSKQSGRNFICGMHSWGEALERAANVSRQNKHTGARGSFGCVRMNFGASVA